MLFDSRVVYSLMFELVKVLHRLDLKVLLLKVFPLLNALSVVLFFVVEYLLSLFALIALSSVPYRSFHLGLNGVQLVL